ncbi:hypothetical protein D9M68_524650 [compost metagenome]
MRAIAGVMAIPACRSIAIRSGAFDTLLASQSSGLCGFGLNHEIEPGSKNRADYTEELSSVIWC